MCMPQHFFTSDTHFFHTGILRHRTRFADVDEMHEHLVSQWNSVVQPNDIVWHLGDVGFAKIDKLHPYLSRLNGCKRLILGNHDEETPSIGKWDGWTDVDKHKLVRIGEHKIVLCHYPMLEWDGMCRGTYHLFGHVHGMTKGIGASMDVGVDVHNYTPISFDEVLQIMQQLKTVSD